MHCTCRELIVFTCEGWLKMCCGAVGVTRCLPVSMARVLSSTWIDQVDLSVVDDERSRIDNSSRRLTDLSHRTAPLYTLLPTYPPCISGAVGSSQTTLVDWDVTCMLNHCLEWYKWVSANLYHDRQWFNTLIAWPFTRWRHIPNDIILQTSSSDPWN